MKNIKQWIYNGRVSRLRFWVQIAAFGFFMYGGYWGWSLGQNLPLFSCPYNRPNGGTCFLISLQHRLENRLDVLFSYQGMALLTAFLTFLAFFLILNKAWCGFLCPLGTLQDWITRLRQKLGFRFARYEHTTFRKLKVVKYLFLVWLLVVPLLIVNSILGLPTLSHDFFPPFCTICPARIILPMFSGDFSQLQVDFHSTVSMVMSSLGVLFAGLFLVGSFVKKRFFCLFCPMSALHYLFSRGAALRLEKNGDRCTRCGNCYHVCDVSIKEIADDVTSKNIVKDDCLMCFKCVEACPEDDCLTVTFFKLPIYKSTEEGFFKRYHQTE